MVVVVADVATGVVVVVVVTGIVVVVVVLMVVLVVFGGLGYATTELIEARARIAPVEKRIMMTGGKTKGSIIERISCFIFALASCIQRSAHIPRVLHCRFLYIGAIVAS